MYSAQKIEIFCSLQALGDVHPGDDFPGCASKTLLGCTSIGASPALGHVTLCFIALCLFANWPPFILLSCFCQEHFLCVFVQRQRMQVIGGPALNFRGRGGGVCVFVAFRSFASPLPERSFFRRGPHKVLGGLVSASS